MNKHTFDSKRLGVGIGPSMAINRLYGTCPLLAALMVLALSAAGWGQIITTVAGCGDPADGTTYGCGMGDGGLATQAQLSEPHGVMVDGTGHLYIADTRNHRVRRVDAVTGVITTVAGTGELGYAGDGGPAAQAQLADPRSVAVDGAGHLYIAESRNARIRRVDAITGLITTVAGTGAQGYSGDGGPATQAQLYGPRGVAVDGAGHLYIADSRNHRIRRVDGSTGVITTLAGTGEEGYAGDEGLATLSNLNYPDGIFVDTAGHLYIADWGNYCIRRVDALTGVITTVAGRGEGGNAGDGGLALQAPMHQPRTVAVDGAGHLYIATSNRIRRVDAITGVITTAVGTGVRGDGGDGGPATRAQLWYPQGVVVDGAGHLYIVDSRNHRIRRVDGSTGIVTTVAGTGEEGYSGDGGPAVQAQLRYPQGVAVDSAGNLYIAATWNHRIRRVDATTGIITTVVGNGVRGYAGDGGPATQAQLSRPSGVAVDGAGHLYFADVGNHRIRRVDAVTGVTTTVVGTGKRGYVGDGGPAIHAQLNSPTDVAFDGAGDLYIVDEDNHRIRRVDAITSVITTVAGGGRDVPGDGVPATQARLHGPAAVAVDGAGNVYFSDGIHIRWVEAETGLIKTLSGEWGFEFDWSTISSNVASDRAGNVYATKVCNIWRVEGPTGIITRVAGSGTNECGYAGDGGPATQAQLSRPGSMAFDAAGNLYIADKENCRIRKVTFPPSDNSADTAADFDGDGAVTLADFFQFADAFGGSDPHYDLDGSGVVDLADFFLFADHFDGNGAKLMGLVQEYLGLRVGLSVAQNHPNPFNSRTLIRFALPTNDPVTLTVYNLTGQRVTTLVDGLRQAGTYTVAWDGRGAQGRALASGVYLYRLQAGAQVETRKLVLVR